jgi:hypothetical protein
MKKTQWMDFINKYYLSGECESVILEVQDKQMKCKFINDSKTVLGSVTLNKTTMGDGNLGVYQTSSLLKILTALDDEIDIKYEEREDTLTKILISDKTISAEFVLADPDIIPEVPPMKNNPEEDLMFEFTPDLIDKFNKSNNALPDAASFAILTTDIGISMVLNYSDLATNRIEIAIPKVIKVKKIDVIYFPAKLFQNIINANKNASKCIIKISEQGLATIAFKGETFNSIYYLVRTVA